MVFLNWDEGYIIISEKGGSYVMSVAEAQGIVLEACRIVLFAWAVVQLLCGLYFALEMGRKKYEAVIEYFIQGNNSAYYPVVKVDTGKGALFFSVREGRFIWNQKEGDRITVAIPKKGKGVARLVSYKRQLTEGFLLVLSSAAVACCGIFLF